MPPKLPRPMPRQPNSSQSQSTNNSIASNATISSCGTEASVGNEMTLGNVKVGRSGIVPLDDSIKAPTVSIDDLQFVKELGAGAHGSVSLYVHKENKKRYAVKKINVASKTQAMSMVAAEIRNIFVDDSQFSVTLHNGFLRDGHLLLIMEYMNGGNLEDLLKLRPRMPSSLAAYLADQVLHGLDQLHQKHKMVDATKSKRLIHRDIKPANIMLGKAGEVKIADFGVAGSAETIGLASFVGTATYMSPERIKGQVYGTGSDIWSVGIVVAEALKGKYPFESAGSGFMQLLKQVTSGERVSLPEDVEPEAQDFIDNCLQQDAASRPSAAELLKHPWLQKHCGDANMRAQFGMYIQTLKGGSSVIVDGASSSQAGGSQIGGSSSQPSTPMTAQTSMQLAPQDGSASPPTAPVDSEAA